MNALEPPAKERTPPPPKKQIGVSVVFDNQLVAPAPGPLTAVGAIQHLLVGLHSNALFSGVVCPDGPDTSYARVSVWVSSAI